MDKTILTAKELMISRYEAFVKEDWRYLVQTSFHQTEDELKNSTPIKWLRLDIIDANIDTVEFKAYFTQNNTIQIHHEKSYFAKDNGILKYKNGELYNSKIQRNIECPCGSGKKFKKCCI